MALIKNSLGKTLYFLYNIHDYAKSTPLTANRLVHILVSLYKHCQVLIGSIRRYDKPSIENEAHKKVYLLLDFDIFT